MSEWGSPVCETSMDPTASEPSEMKERVAASTGSSTEPCAEYWCEGKRPGESRAHSMLEKHADGDAGVHSPNAFPKEPRYRPP